MHTTADPCVEIAERQIAFRIQNEQIEAAGDEMGLIRPIPFVCECADAACTEIVQLSFDEYEAIRVHPRRFFNVTGHEASSVEAGAEKILVMLQDVTIVEKIGLAGDLATAAHHAVER